MWFRVFGTSEMQPEPEALLAYLRDRQVEVTGQFRADDQGWFRAEIHDGASGSCVQIDCFLVSEEGIRPEMNNWAAWLETRESNPNSAQLMQQVISAKRLYAMQVSPETDEKGAAGLLSVLLCRFLAGATAGVYQVDDEGFYSANGVLLVSEEDV
jgi:hypothetical protein